MTEIEREGMNNAGTTQTILITRDEHCPRVMCHYCTDLPEYFTCQIVCIICDEYDTANIEKI